MNSFGRMKWSKHWNNLDLTDILTYIMKFYRLHKIKSERSILKQYYFFGNRERRLINRASSMFISCLNSKSVSIFTVSFQMRVLY